MLLFLYRQNATPRPWPSGSGAPQSAAAAAVQSAVDDVVEATKACIDDCVSAYQKSYEKVLAGDYKADDVVQVVGTAMQAGVRYPALRDALPIHPTVAEYIPSILSSLQPLD